LSRGEARRPIIGEQGDKRNEAASRAWLGLRLTLIEAARGRNLKKRMEGEGRGEEGQVRMRMSLRVLCPTLEE
jgi:hypothetical protein